MSKNLQAKKCLIVPHTHWDREWYVTFEEFRSKLVKMIDQLIEVCLAEPEFIFTLDGQTIVLDDYLEVRPENKNILEALIQQKRILIGPWYTQCDTRLINGESIVRNLLLGAEKAEVWGNVCRIGYLPDNFGNIGQLPQILSGFDIDNFISGRGIDCSKNEFQWIGDDGTKILGVFQRFGYPTYNLDRKLTNKENATDKFKENIERLIDFEASDTILLAPGGDHCFPEAGLTGFAKYAAKRLNINMQTGGYQDYVKAIKEKIDEYPIVKGELNIAASRYLHASGVLAARMPVKRENKKLENMLMFQAEPLSVMANVLTNKKYEEEYLGLAWKNLMQNHAHDSIYGCCIDEVFNDVMPRFFKTEQISQQIIKGTMNSIGTSIEQVKNEMKRIVVFNSLAFDRDELVSLKVALPNKINNFELIDTKQQKIAFWSKKVPAAKMVQSSLEDEIQEYNIYFQANIPAAGYAAYYILPSAKQNHSLHKTSITPTFENSYYKAEVMPSGAINLLDKTNNKKYSNLNYFIDGGNTGDLFTYSPPLNDKLINSLKTSAKISIIHQDNFCLQIKAEIILKIPENLARNKTARLKKTVKLPVTVIYTFYTSAKRIDVKTSFRNQALNHRLRVHFPVGENVSIANADAQFFLQKRRSGSEDYPFIWDKPQGLHPAHGFVQAGKDQGLTIMSGETSQYEVSDKSSEIILTLLLGTGKFRECKNVLTRKQSWDNPIPTPGAQCLGEHTYNYSIIIGSDIASREQALCAMHPVICDSFKYSCGHLLSSYSMFSLGNTEIRISAFKKHHKNDNIILRLYNPSSKPIKTKLSLSEFRPSKYRFVKLNEKILDDFINLENSIELSFSSGEIKTIEFSITL